MTPIGLYLHVPFCVRKCGYCDFASYAGQEAFFAPIVSAMKREIEKAEGLSIGTAFVGGGTPTVLPVEMLVDVLTTARERFAWERDAEISVEANPGTVDAGKLSALREAGVNRLSIGAQAAQGDLLNALGRIHRWDDVENAFHLARSAGFSNINLDLMYGLPGQTPKAFRETMEAALFLRPEHLSIYSLILEEGTPFFMEYANRLEALPGEDAAAEMSDDALWMAEDAGLRRYEISNYALPGHECKHNLGYWLRKDYLGVGCAAHSLLHNHRWANARTIDGYLAGLRDEESVISDEEARFERLMLGLRLVDGIPWEEQVLFDQYKGKLQKLRVQGLVEWNEARLWLTRRGLDLQNRVMVTLMEEE